jgi:hypothetical protein
MRKSDETIRNLVTASIKRHSIEIETWERTKLWDDLPENIRLIMLQHLRDKTGELGIIAYVESSNYWNLITTRGVVIAEGQNISRVNLNEIEHYEVGDLEIESAHQEGRHLCARYRLARAIIAATTT